MIALLLVPIVFLSMSVFERYQAERDTREKRAERALELEEVAARAAALEAQVEEAESARGIEAEIRSRYDVAKEGERVIVIVDEEDEGGGGEVVPIARPEKETFFQKLKFW